jgi:hypothetical protein
MRVELKYWPFIVGGIILDIILCDCNFLNSRDFLKVNIGII